MLLLRLRCVIHLALALTLAVGLAAQGAAGTHAKPSSHAHAMAAHMTMAHADSTPMCNKYDGCENGSCTGDECLSSGVCSACSGNLIALPVFGMVIALPLRETGDTGPFPFQAGWAAPPDPYPPRTIILS